MTESKMGSYTGDHNAKKSRLGTASNEITGGGGGGLQLVLVCGRPTLALSSALVSQTLSCLVCVEDS